MHVDKFKLTSIKRMIINTRNFRLLFTTMLMVK